MASTPPPADKPKPKPKPAPRRADEPAPQPQVREPIVSRAVVYNGSAFLTSLIVHLVGLVVLGLIALPQIVPPEILPLEILQREEEEERLDTQILDESFTPSLEQAVAVLPTPQGTDGEPLADEVASVPAMPQKMVVNTSVKVDTSVDIESLIRLTPDSKPLIDAVPYGTVGEPRAVVDNYEQAMDRITNELRMLMDISPVLVVWLFDQSISMRDDQQEIQSRIARVYQELGLLGRDNGRWLTTGIASYGAGFQVHTRNPTSNVEAIKRAIAQVPVDPSGKEVMCQAIIKTIAAHRRAANGRKLALIVVSDETGEREDNLQYLEAAIAEAKAAECHCYFLGREAVFGYPYAFMRWEHPGTGRIHWLRVDRGPETAFVELLQTNGFRRRHDAFASGFGPYEQARMARETGGIFFMLPSLEISIVRGEKRRYELEAMDKYGPDLRSRAEIDQDNADSLLIVRSNQVINTLNPYNPQVQPHIEMRIHFSPDPATFRQQVQREKVKAAEYVLYLDRAEKVFESEEMLYARSQETSPRWQANYDLLRAQILAYKVRMFEYGAYLEWFEQNPVVVPLTKPPDKKLVHWDITTRQKTLTDELSGAYRERSQELFETVIANHPGTPWAARAQWELKRGFGVHLVPHYRAPYRTYSGPPIKIPDL